MKTQKTNVLTSRIPALISLINSLSEEQALQEYLKISSITKSSSFIQKIYPAEQALIRIYKDPLNIVAVIKNKEGTITRYTSNSIDYYNSSSDFYYKCLYQFFDDLNHFDIEEINLYLPRHKLYLVEEYNHD